MPQYELSRSILVDLLAPIVSAVIFAYILTYFTLVRKRISKVYPYYALFLVSFIIFIVGRPFQVYASYLHPHDTLYVRMLFLHGLGIPSLLFAASIQSGVRHRKIWAWSSYGIGVLISVLYCIAADAGSDQRWFSQDLLLNNGLPLGFKAAHNLQFIAALVMLVIPCSILIIRGTRSGKNAKLIAYLAGSLIFGICINIATPHPMKLEFIYVGSTIHL